MIDTEITFQDNWDIYQLSEQGYCSGAGTPDGKTNPKKYV